MADMLLLYLEGPLQSWGLRAKWDVRDTGDEPSKSGVVGLLGCALGYAVGDARLEKLDEGLRMGVRVERSGSKLVDYQTVTGVIPTAQGKMRGTEAAPYTIVSPRVYLQDAAFLVALQGPRELLKKCAAALRRPRWPVFLGRKACVPARPVLQELTDRYESLEHALRHYPWQADPNRGDLPDQVRCIIEDEDGPGLRPDRMRTNPDRMYEQRSVRVVWFPRPDGAMEAGS